jgi:dephospho-CoA kinase
VARRYNDWVEKQHAPYVVKEAALLFESKNNLLVDRVISVSAPAELRIQRAMQRDQRSEDEVRKRMLHQLSDEERNRLSDFVIVNDNVLPLLPQILAVHEKVKSRQYAIGNRQEGERGQG